MTHQFKFGDLVLWDINPSPFVFMGVSKIDPDLAWIRADNDLPYFAPFGELQPVPHPDTVRLDFTALPFADDSFNLVVFDPPHLVRAGKKSWLAKKYGRLTQDWRDDLSKGFAECFRVLKPNGVLIFKWNEDQIKVPEILELTPEKPLFGHPTGRHGRTHWFTFLKG